MKNQKLNNKQKKVLAGIRATGRLHLGNYLGAVKGMLELQNDPQYQTLYMVADVHTITTPYDVEELQKNRREVILDYLAAGLDPEKSVLFIQSMVPEHVELQFYFSSVITMARMQHLPTFKDKAKQYPQHVTMALLNYPVLQAADILAYQANLVPAGLDQEPHLEVTREIARKMNDQYGLNLPESKRFETSGSYVPSLLGEGKMSKSVEGSAIDLSDDLKTIQKKLAKAPTDSGKGESVPTSGGVANLLTLVEMFQGKEQKKEYQQAYLGEGLRYGDLKKGLAEAIYAELKPLQEKRAELEANPECVDQVIAQGAARARKIAGETLQEVKEKMGLG
jgi:tryptophanyl-tRNA synthetase